ncbi:hypothetical protein BKA80DRAFT_333809 [Phyllosticta citrichinensis]
MAGPSKRGVHQAKAREDRERQQLGVSRQPQVPQTSSVFSMAPGVPDISGSDQTVVTLKVGPNHKVFLVHTSIICNASLFFNNAFKGEFKEGKTQIMTLEDTEEDVFKVVMQWLYTRRLPNLWNKDQQHIKTIRICEGQGEELLWDFLMTSAYVFSQTYVIPALSVAIEVRLSERFGHTCSGVAGFQSFLTYPAIIRLFNNVPENSPACKLLVNTFATQWEIHGGIDVGGKHFDDLPANFISQALKAVSKIWAASSKKLQAQDNKLEIQDKRLQSQDKELQSKSREIQTLRRDLQYRAREVRVKDQKIRELCSTQDVPSQPKHDSELKEKLDAMFESSQID